MGAVTINSRWTSNRSSSCTHQWENLFWARSTLWLEWIHSRLLGTNPPLKKLHAPGIYLHSRSPREQSQRRIARDPQTEDHHLHRRFGLRKIFHRVRYHCHGSAATSE